MVQSSDPQFQKVQAFHQVMDGSVPQSPEAFSYETTLHRADFKLEELVELVAASSVDDQAFDAGVQHLHQALDKAVEKIKAKGNNGQDTGLVGQVDALLDILYLTYGSFVLLGVDPKPIFEIVHKANMGKIWPDGKAHYDPVTHKILKPDNWERDFAPEAKIKAELERQVQKSVDASCLFDCEIDENKVQ